MTTATSHLGARAAVATRDDAHRDVSHVREFVTYLAIGTLFGVVITKGEVISWYRIQEMFRFQSFHMYGVLGSAMFTAMLSLEVLKRTGARARTGEEISVPRKTLGKGTRYWVGGSLFGVGWAFTGACPGPL